LALLAGAEADLWLLWHWSQPRRSAPGAADARLRARPWQPVDAALLLAVIVLSALPALSRALHPETAEATPSATSLILMGLLGYAVIGAALALVVWRTGAGAGILFGERARLAADLRAGVLYGLATTPPVLLVSWGVAALMQSCGLSAPEQAVFDWLGDPTLPVSARIFLIAAAIALAPLAEEGIFRGVLLPALLRKHGPAYALILLNVLFALLHFNAPAFAPLLLAGICFSLGMRATGSVVTPIVMHAVFNVEMLLFFLAFPQLTGA